jgi:hypothetical protein
MIPVGEGGPGWANSIPRGALTPTAVPLSLTPEHAPLVSVSGQADAPGYLPGTVGGGVLAVAAVTGVAVQA